MIKSFSDDPIEYNEEINDEIATEVENDSEHHDDENRTLFEASDNYRLVNDETDENRSQLHEVRVAIVESESESYLDDEERSVSTPPANETLVDYDRNDPRDAVEAINRLIEQSKEFQEASVAMWAADKADTNETKKALMFRLKFIGILIGTGFAIAEILIPVILWLKDRNDSDTEEKIAAPKRMQFHTVGYTEDNWPYNDMVDKALPDSLKKSLLESMKNWDTMSDKTYYSILQRYNRKFNMMIGDQIMQLQYSKLLTPLHEEWNWTCQSKVTFINKIIAAYENSNKDINAIYDVLKDAQAEIKIHGKKQMKAIPRAVSLASAQLALTHIWKQDFQNTQDVAEKELQLEEA